MHIQGVNKGGWIMSSLLTILRVSRVQVRQVERVGVKYGTRHPLITSRYRQRTQSFAVAFRTL